MFTLIYLSETGVGQTVGERIHKEAPSHGLECRLFNAEDHAQVPWSSDARVFVFISSSTGDGDPPAKAVKFWRWLRTQPNGSMAGAQIALLGLGDSNYSSYMQMPRRLHKQLLQLGATEFLPHVEADDATPAGLETAIEPWVERLWRALETVVRASGSSNSASAAAAPIRAASAPAGLHPRLPLIGFECIVADTEPSVRGFSLSSVYVCVRMTSLQASHVEPDTWTARIDDARWLTTPAALKQVVHVTLASAVAGQPRPHFAPGDALALRCPNDAAVVARVLARLPAAQRGNVACAPADRASWPGHVPTPVQAFQALSWFVDLGALPSKRLLRALAEHCSADADRQALLDMCEISAAGKERYAALAARRAGALQVLDAHPSCVPPLAVLLALLPPMVPRFYSVAGLPDADRVSVALTVVREQQFRGACSNWLCDVARASKRLVMGTHIADHVGSGDADAVLLRQLSYLTGLTSALAVPVHTRAPTSFRLPDVLHVPIIMVGPGTGVAPFLAFLEHIKTARARDASAFPAVQLYAGCRSRTADYLFGAELERYAATGVLSGLHVAVSREEDRKYVQHLIDDHWATVADTLMKHKGRLYVCGDARNMAPAVQEAVLRAFERSGLAAADAAQLLATLKTESRYVIDVWA